jgi:NADH-quinone oxidoreductase subunit K
LLYFIALEIIVLAINLNFAFFGITSDDAKGFFIALLLLALAAIDTAIGLSLLVKFFRSNILGGTKISSLIFLKG